MMTAIIGGPGMYGFPPLPLDHVCRILPPSPASPRTGALARETRPGDDHTMRCEVGIWGAGDGTVVLEESQTGGNG